MIRGLYLFKFYVFWAHYKDIPQKKSAITYLSQTRMLEHFWKILYAAL